MTEAVPSATFRFQFHKDFTFAQGSDLVPYLVELGISHAYSSPILTATPGSVHGYDVIDTTQVNPEIGGEDGLRGFVAALRRHGLGLIVDIVPNHMAVGGMRNAWWADVLRNGQDSPYATFFDIDWNADDPTLHGKVLAPFLGKDYGDALADGEIRLDTSHGGEAVVAYFDNHFPLRPADQDHVRSSGAEAFDPASPDGRKRLHELLERQHYRLAWWGVAGDEINWRRFFDINGLIGLRTELPDVFEAAHATLFRLFADGLIDGFRIDHVDGLTDPSAYCRRLRQRLGELSAQRPPRGDQGHPQQGRPYIVVEKILGRGEALPEEWDVDGTTGYDFMNEVSALQHDAAGRGSLEQLWHAQTGRPADFTVEETQARREILEYSFGAQLSATARSLHQAARSNPATRDVSFLSIRRGLMRLLEHFPVYRTYHAGMRRDAQDETSFQAALQAARASAPSPDLRVLPHLDQWLGGVATEDPALVRAQTRFQQLSAPVAAKSVEDTAFYRYGRLLSRNDVGFDADRLGCSVADFHQACERRQSTFPHAMLATATHDHKRGEDVRARLAVLSEIPDEWADLVARCRRMQPAAPDVAAELMLYQTVVGTLPAEFDQSDAPACEAYANRLSAWQRKSLREAKLRTSWAAPDAAFEDAAEHFLRTLVRPDSERLAALHSFMQRIHPAGAVNGLAQALLKMTAPGMPDFFQGTDFWDLSMVDPDNRRPVDYAARQASVARRNVPVDVLPQWRDGRVKQAMIASVLRFRRSSPALFANGAYRALPVAGQVSDHLIAFARHTPDAVAIVVAPRLVNALRPDRASLRLQALHRGETRIALPPEWRGRRWHSVLLGRDTELDDHVCAAAALEDFPMAVLATA